MSFISLTFAIFFFVFVCLYHLAARLFKDAPLAQRILLLAASLVFYAWADLRFVPFLAYVVAVSYFGGLSFCIGGGYRRLRLLALCAACLAPLLFFKYAPRELHPDIIFPLGLSFFTFQSLSYVADCFKKKVEPERSLLNVALFISFFPVVSSGPIQRAGNLIPQFKEAHRFDYGSATDGLKLFAWGMFKKLCVADRIAAYVNYVYGSAGSQYGSALLLATVLYSFQIYCDFSGYSDMAIGVAKYCGFDVGKNFDHPYLAQSVGDFWRRWHISLSSWLRDYVYIPLGGSRVALPRIYFNLLATFLVSGIWHGAGWTFVVWGALHGLYQCAGRAAKPLLEKAKIPAAVKIFVTFCLVTFAWIFFRAESLGQAALVIRKIAEVPKCAADFFAMKGEVGATEALRAVFSFTDEACGGFKGMLCIFAFAIIFCAASLCVKKTGGLEFVRSKPLVFRWILYAALCSALLPALVSNSNTEFLYFAF